MDLKKALKTNWKYITLLNTNGINTLEDLFYYFPRAYEDRTKIKKLTEVSLDWTIQLVKWKIISKNFIKTPKWKQLVEMAFEDISWNKSLIQFLNSTFALREIKADKWYVIIWKPKFERWKFIFWHPELVSTEEDDWWYNTWKIYPIYSELSWIKAAWFAKKIWENINNINIIEDTLPKDFLDQFDLMYLQDAIKNIHFPENFALINEAKFRIFFERLLRVQLISLLTRLEYQGNWEWRIKNWEVTEPNRNLIKDFISKLPFELTNAQKKVIKDIIENFYQAKPMMRLLQWDVWSWKTIVAIITAFYNIKVFWWQAAFLAPTEVLASQQFKNIAKLLLPLWLRVEYISWSTTKTQKEKIKADLISWAIDFVVWTHALIQEDVDFNNLKYVIIDEQHKFWVKQRSFFKKFWSPHILQMTATPIPRSLTLAFFWEFDVSIINELPAWRRPITTKIIDNKELAKLKPWIMTKIWQWQQIFIVTPLIEESEKLDEVKSAVTEYEETRNWLHEISAQIWLMHGKLKPKEKDEIMLKFKEWKYKVLISTTVIEVWVDIPQATIMIIKNSERFWLSQLHQLRWRVWRNDLNSYCFLETRSKTWDTYKRLKAMEQYNDWFKLAEIDLQTRWGGEILGTRQSWETDVPLEILTDVKFLEKVQQAAHWLLEKYPNLKWLDKLKKIITSWDKNVLA